MSWPDLAFFAVDGIAAFALGWYGYRYCHRPARDAKGRFVSKDYNKRPDLRPFTVIPPDVIQDVAEHGDKWTVEEQPVKAPEDKDLCVCGHIWHRHSELHPHVCLEFCLCCEFRLAHDEQIANEG